MTSGMTALLLEYLRAVVGNGWSVLLFVSGALSLVERLFNFKFKIPRWVGVSLIVSAIVVGQTIAYINVAEAPPLVVKTSPPTAPIIATAAADPSVQQTTVAHAPSPVAVTNNAPNGFAISGGQVQSPVVNNYAPPARTLSPDQRTQLVSSLKGNSSFSIVARHAQGNYEAQTYEDALVSALRDGGWTVNDTPGFVFESRQGQGVKILVNDLKNPPPGAIILQRAMMQVGIDAEGAAMPEQIGAKDMVLYVGVQ